MRIVSIEWTKIKKAPYLWALTGFLLFNLFVVLLFLFLPEEELGLGLMERNWKFLSMLLSCVTLAEFTILGAALNAKVTLDEYMGKKVLLLFSYPVERKALFRAKTAICWCLTAGSAWIMNFMIILIAGGISNLFQIMPKGLGGSELVYALVHSVEVAVLAGCVGLISLWFGFWKSSVIVEIISSLIMIMPVTNMISSQIIWGTGMITIVILALVISIVVCKKLEFKIKNMEVL